MRLLTAIIAIICGLSILVGSAMLLTRETGLLNTFMDVIGRTDHPDSPTSKDSIDAASPLNAGNDALSAELAKVVEAQLRAQPTQSVAWLWLAEMVRPQSPERFNAALRLSVVTAPREASIILERAILGLKHWDALNSQLRRSTIGDLLVLLVPRLTRQPFGRIRAAIASQKPETRQEITNALAARGVSRLWLKRLRLL